jgi:hypothetical protein
MTTVDFADVCIAIVYEAAFILTWGTERDIEPSPLMRRRWLQRHMTERPKVERV